MIERKYHNLDVTQDGVAARLELTNPGRRNAIGPRMVNELLYAIEDALEDDAVRCIVITGAGDAFCAGGDFSQMTAGADADELPPKGSYSDLLLAILRCEKPLIARVNGHAMGGGLGLVAACHFAVASSEAKLGTPEIKVGLFPMMIMAVLARVVPRRRLLEMMLFGERMTAARAEELGLVGRVVPPGELDGAVAEIVEKIASKSPLTVKLGLRAFADQGDLALAEAVPLLEARLGECLATEDAREGLMAFLEKRSPVWTGK